ncbi:unnamed protein product [Hapterophycus canaliculatus]
MYQSRFFDGEKSRPGRPCYGCSTHYHYVSRPESPEAWHGAKMVHSDITEMLANIFISKAVGSKAALHEKEGRFPAANESALEEHPQFQVCADCPAKLLPFHVKAVPDLACVSERSLAGDASVGSAWGGSTCPKWCKGKDVSFKAGNRIVRICPLRGSSHRS